MTKLVSIYFPFLSYIFHAKYLTHDIKTFNIFSFFFFCKRFSQFSSTNNISIPMEFDTREYLYLNISYPKFHLEFDHPPYFQFHLSPFKLAK